MGVPIKEPVVPLGFGLPGLQDQRKSRDGLVPLRFLLMLQDSATGEEPSVRSIAGSCRPTAVCRADLGDLR